jgi:hypothetical protein
MKIKLFAAAIAAMSFFASCDKCKKADCQNDATCEKKVGDCVCTDFYEGDKCETEVRKAYFGTFSGTITFTLFGSTSTDDIKMTASSYSTAQNFQLKDSEDATAGAIYCQLTSKTAFKITGDTETDGDFSGTGTISKSSLTASGNYTITEGGLNLAVPFSISATK